MAPQPRRRQVIVPMLAYEDGAGAMDWLVEAFGFVERSRMVENGRLSHGELALDDSVVMLAAPTDYQGPRRHREECEAARRWSQMPWIIDGVMVYVPDIRAHFERARVAGATILTEVERASFGGWLYRAEDVEGHRWMFVQADE